VQLYSTNKYLAWYSII